MSNNLLMAQAFGDAVGATKRQIQFWTDRGAVKCVAGTDQQGRGKQRLYDEAEIPIARLIAQMAAFQLPIGRLIESAHLIRGFANLQGRGTTAPRQPGGFPASWHHAALAGKHESFICLRPGIDSFMWTDRKKMKEMVDINAVIVIPVHEIVKRAVSR